jgi:hypothetical protein
MARVTINRVAGPLAALNPASSQWLSDGVLVAVPGPNGSVVAVRIPAAVVVSLVEDAFAASGAPLPMEMGAPSIGGLFSRVRKAAQRAVPKKLQRAAKKATRRIEKEARRVERVSRQARSVYGSPYMTAALTALSATPLAPVAGPMAAGSMYFATADRAARTVRNALRGNWEEMAWAGAEMVPGAGGYVSTARGLSRGIPRRRVRRR